jgi:protein SCO1/2
MALKIKYYGAGLLLALLIGLGPRIFSDNISFFSLDFSKINLINQFGNPVSYADLKDKYLFVYFGYTSCPDVCPTTLSSIVRAYNELSETEQKKIIPIFITVDPLRDSSDRLKDYLAVFSPHILGLTGDEPSIQKLLEYFHIVTKKINKQSGDYDIDHSSVIYIFDRKGKFMKRLSAQSDEEKIIVAMHKLSAQL